MAQKSQATREVRIKKSTNPITGMINVVGETDSGKTWFSMGSGAAPERTVFLDDDVKGNSIVREVLAAGRSFGIYRNLMLETKGMREIEFHNHVMKILQDIEPGQFDAIIFDTWTRFENTFHPVVAKDPMKYRQFYSSMGQIKGAEQWQASFDLESATIAALQETFPLVFLVSHLKKDANKKEIAESKKPLIQKARMRVWLRHSSNTPKPTAIMLKRLSKVRFTSNGGLLPINVTQQKVLEFDWAKLLYYWENPVDETPPTPEEQLTEFEMSILTSVLTQDQKDALRLAVLEAEKERDEQIRADREMRRVMGKKERVEKTPEIPEDPFQLIAKAMEIYKLELDDIAVILGIDPDNIMDMEVGDVQDAWETIKQHEAENNTSKSSNKKRK